MNKNVSPFVENISEATVACLVTMVQGNVLAIGMGHLIIASQTGVTAGVVTATAILLSQTHRRGLIALMLGLITAVVDCLVHPGTFRAVFAEAIVTGVGAAVLSYLISTVIDLVRRRNVAP